MRQASHRTGARARWGLGLLTLALFGLLVLPPPPVAASSFQLTTQERSLTTLVNQARRAAGAPLLRVDATLVTVARARSRDMGTRHYFSHQIPPDGHNVFAMLDARQYCYALAGENIGWDTAPAAVVMAALQARFLASPEHRQNELNPRWKAIGVGVFYAGDRTLVTVLFAIRCPVA